MKTISLIVHLIRLSQFVLEFILRSFSLIIRLGKGKYKLWRMKRRNLQHRTQKNRIQGITNKLNFPV